MAGNRFVDAFASLQDGVDHLAFNAGSVILDGDLPASLGPDARVKVQIKGDELERELSMTGVVRRFQTRPCGRGKEETLLGLEFVVADADDRQATQKIRQYVMARQRSLLTSRSSDAVGTAI